MKKSSMINTENKHRRKYGLHLTSEDIFWQYVFPEIKDKLLYYLWVDLFAGEGNLILPILEKIKPEERINFFSNHIFLSDIQEEMVEKCVVKAEYFGIPRDVAILNIIKRDNLLEFPQNLRKNKHPIFHITNPPYLYLGYIRKHTETQSLLKYFEHENKGFQDLYQIAMINDLRNNIKNLIYIIPSNFLFGASVSNKFRLEFLKSYNIVKMFIFERKSFKYTGTNICIGFFERKKSNKLDELNFPGIKIKKKGNNIVKRYTLKPEYKFRAGYEFDEFLKRNKAVPHLSVNYYLKKEEMLNHKGKNKIIVLDANNYEKNEYGRLQFEVNDFMKNKINSNILYLKTVDSGSPDGRVGMGLIKNDFNVQAICVTTKTYRTHPMQIFFEPQISVNDQVLLKNYFNFILEYFREKLDSEFLTTYKYSNAQYTRKYLGLTQARSLIHTFPYNKLLKDNKVKLARLIQNENSEKLFEFLKDLLKKNTNA